VMGSRSDPPTPTPTSSAAVGTATVRIFEDNSVVRRLANALVLARWPTTSTVEQRKRPQIPYMPDTERGKISSLEKDATAYATHILGDDLDPARALARRVLLGSLAAISRTFMYAFNTTEVHNWKGLHDALAEHADTGRGIVTVCNHVASLDDPLVVAASMPLRYVFDARGLRYTMCATDRCFSKGATLSEFFRLVKVLPVERGLGLSQPGMVAAETALQRGDWVHVFPEGTRSRDGSIAPARRGAAKLALARSEDGTLPLVVPFAHVGMEGVIGIGNVLPRGGNVVVVVVGDPIDMSCCTKNCTNEEAQQRATQRISDALLQLHNVARKRHDELSGRNAV